MLRKEIEYSNDFQDLQQDCILGWSLIRGEPKNWPDESEIRAVEELSGLVDSLGTAWQILNQRRLARENPNEAPSVWQSTLTMLEARQVALLDAVRAVNMIGRPFAGNVLLRSMYECLLSAIYIGYKTGPISKDNARNPKDNLNPTLEEIAERFQSFSHHARLQSLETIRESSRTTIKDEDYKLVEKIGLEARDKYGFSTRNNTWHPFKGMWFMRQHLWPEGRRRRFPRIAIPIDYRTWRGLYLMCYSIVSHDVHISSASLHKTEMAIEDDETRKMARRQWDDSSLVWAKFLAELTISVIAHAEGNLDIWVDCLLEVPTHSFRTKDEKAKAR